MTGRVQDDLPRVRLDLHGFNGSVTVEFVIDTGFDGELALPASLLVRINSAFIGERYVYMADMSLRLVKHYRAMLDWQDEERVVEIMELDGRPLVGTLFLRGNLIQIEMEDGGEVLIEPL